MLRLWILPVLGLIAALGFACGDSGDDKPQTAATATLTASGASFTATATPIAAFSATPIPTTVWKRFTNTDYGFSFQYPASWYLDVHGLDPTTKMDYTAISNYPTRPSEGATPAAGLFWMEMYVDSNPESLALTEWISRYHAMPGEPADVVVTSQDITVGKHAGIEQTVIEGYIQAAPPVHEHFFALTNGILVTNGPDAESPWLPTYEQVVNSLVFSQVP